MGKLLIVAGNLASLKTTISKQLASTLNVPCINKDDIKELLVDSIDFKTREENLKLSQATFQLIKYVSAQVLNSQAKLIVESNFKPYEIEEILTQLSLESKEVKMLFLTGNPVSLYERYLARQENRHRAHTSTGLISYSVFESSMLKVDDFDFPEILDIDTTIFTDKDFENLKFKIKEFFE